MASSVSKSKSVRLPNELWDALEWVASAENKRVNDIIKEAVVEVCSRYPVPVNVEPGQTSIFDEVDGMTSDEDWQAIDDAVNSLTS